MTIEQQPATGHLTLTCPDCGAAVTTTPGRRSAGDFCTQCDFPMFWARPSDLTVATANSDDALRRMPGVDGTRAVAQVACPTCAELNGLDARFCLRCSGPMVLPTPAPAPEPPAPQPAVVVVEEVVTCSHLPTWQIGLISAAVTVTACLALALLIAFVF